MVINVSPLTALVILIVLGSWLVAWCFIKVGSWLKQRDQQDAHRSYKNSFKQTRS